MKTIKKPLTAQQQMASRHAEMHDLLVRIAAGWTKLKDLERIDWGHVGSMGEAVRLLKRADEIMTEITK